MKSDCTRELWIGDRKTELSLFEVEENTFQLKTKEDLSSLLSHYPICESGYLLPNLFVNRLSPKTACYLHAPRLFLSPNSFHGDFQSCRLLPKLNVAFWSLSLPEEIELSFLSWSQPEMNRLRKNPSPNLLDLFHVSNPLSISETWRNLSSQIMEKTETGVILDAGTFLPRGRLVAFFALE